MLISKVQQIIRSAQQRDFTNITWVTLQYRAYVEKNNLLHSSFLMTEPTMTATRRRIRENQKKQFSQCVQFSPWQEKPHYPLPGSLGRIVGPSDSDNNALQQTPRPKPAWFKVPLNRNHMRLSCPEKWIITADAAPIKDINVLKQLFVIASVWRGIAAEVSRCPM